jgi:hypothetical protein
MARALPPRNDRQFRQQRGDNQGRERGADMDAAGRLQQVGVVLQELRAGGSAERERGAGPRGRVQVQHVWVPAADVHRRGVRAGERQPDGQAGVEQ